MEIDIALFRIEQMDGELTTVKHLLHPVDVGQELGPGIIVKGEKASLGLPGHNQVGHRVCILPPLKEFEVLIVEKIIVVWTVVELALVKDVLFLQDIACAEQTHEIGIEPVEIDILGAVARPAVDGVLNPEDDRVVSDGIVNDAAPTR